MDLTEFGDYLKSLRKEKGLSITQLAEESGVSHPYLSQIENGKKKNFPSSEVLIKLSKPLGIHYAKLLKAAGYIDKGTLMVDGQLLVSEEEYRQAKEEMEKSWKIEEIQNELTELFRWWSLLIEDEYGNFATDEIENDFISLVEEYDLEEIKYYNRTPKETPKAFWESVLIKKDLEVSKRVIKDVIKLIKKHTNYRGNISEQGLESRVISPVEIVDLLSTANKITFYGHELTDDERHLALGVLNVLFAKNR